MKKDIVIAGVGGQGILSIAATIGYAAVEAGLYLKQSEVHGMSQRGGEVQSHFRLSDSEIASDLIPFGSADLIISVEPMEGLRYVPMLAPDGWLITNTRPFVNIPNYPDLEKLLEEIDALPRHVAFDADKVAREIGSVKAANIVILGAAAPYLGLKQEYLEHALKLIFGKKGEDTVQLNIRALRQGIDLALNN